MMLKLTRAAVAILALCSATAALAQKPVAFPAKGQSAAQQQKDDGACYTWAKGNTGVDPAALAAAPPPPPPAPAPAPGGQVAGGAVKGAAFGAIVGDSSEAAGKGAVLGMAAGGIKAKKQQQAQAQQQEAQQQQAQQAQQQKMATFYKAYGACMEGHGYTVK